MFGFSRRKAARAALPALPPESVPQTVAWLEDEFATGQGYRFAAGCTESLLATCIGVLAHELFDGFAHLPPERRRTLATSIQATQSPETGLFRDPAHDDAVLFRVAKFTPLYIEWQETYFALHALDALGEKPRFPLQFVEPFRDRRTLHSWLRGLGFDDFWFSSNYLMFLLCFLLESNDTATAHAILDALDARQDPATGFWGTNQGASLFNGLAGAYHLYGFYQYLNRPIAHQGVALASTLKLQEKTGLFGGPCGGPCEDLDAVDVLVKLEPDSPALAREIRSALERALPALESCRLPSGGYSWWPRSCADHLVVKYSNLPNLHVRTDAGDIWSAWFRPLTIALARQHLGTPTGYDARFRKIPLLGWFPGGGAAQRGV